MCVLTVTPSYIMETVIGTHLEKWGGVNKVTAYSEHLKPNAELY